ncbi:MAG: hypothetical protein FJW86_07070 [Actinobacteria bacterium]|nr:hypothetical protein [Actinomycetota bacterium]
MTLSQKIIAIHKALEGADVPHAFGGALALAWCTERARGTIDIDLNVFADREHLDKVIAAMPAEVRRDPAALAHLARDGQARLWWDQTPIDLFLSTTPFHDEVSRRVHVEPFAGSQVPFVSCVDLAVFKAFFDRTRDWADLEEMARAGTLDRERVLGVLVDYLGGDDPRIERLRDLR